MPDCDRECLCISSECCLSSTSKTRERKLQVFSRAIHFGQHSNAVNVIPASYTILQFIELPLTFVFCMSFSIMFISLASQTLCLPTGGRKGSGNSATTFRSHSPRIMENHILACIAYGVRFIYIQCHKKSGPSLNGPPPLTLILQ